MTNYNYFYFQGLVVPYDKHGHDNTREDMADAILAYNNILKALRFVDY